MADNDRIQYNIPDAVPYQQFAPNHAARTSFTPGKATSQPGDENWPEDFRIPVGVRHLEEVPPLERTDVRIVKLHRGSVSDQILPELTVLGTKTTVIDDDATWGATDPEHTVTETDAPDQENTVERTAGYDWAEGADE